eukprot:jgi/Botrbrau1/23019/Bobra.136_1s0011.1
MREPHGLPSWLLDVPASCTSAIPGEPLPPKPQTLRQAAWTLVNEAAKAVVANRLRTPLGDPAETLGAFEKALQGTLTRLEGRRKPVIPGTLGPRPRDPVPECTNPNVAPPWLLLEFLIALEREEANVLSGNPTLSPPNPTVLEFFVKYQQTCLMWHNRIRWTQIRVAMAADHPHAALYHINVQFGLMCDEVKWFLEPRYAAAPQLSALPGERPAGASAAVGGEPQTLAADALPPPGHPAPAVAPTGAGSGDTRPQALPPPAPPALLPLQAAGGPVPPAVPAGPVPAAPAWEPVAVDPPGPPPPASAWVPLAVPGPALDAEEFPPLPSAVVPNPDQGLFPKQAPKPELPAQAQGRGQQPQPRAVPVLATPAAPQGGRKEKGGGKEASSRDAVAGGPDVVPPRMVLLSRRDRPAGDSGPGDRTPIFGNQEGKPPEEVARHVLNQLQELMMYAVSAATRAGDPDLILGFYQRGLSKFGKIVELAGREEVPNLESQLEWMEAMARQAYRLEGGLSVLQQYIVRAADADPFARPPVLAYSAAAVAEAYAAIDDWDSLQAWRLQLQGIQGAIKAKGEPAAQRAAFTLPVKWTNLWLAKASLDWNQWAPGEELLKLAAPALSNPDAPAPTHRLDDWVDANTLRAMLLVGENPKEGAPEAVRALENAWAGTLARTLPLSLGGPNLAIPSLIRLETLRVLSQHTSSGEGLGVPALAEGDARGLYRLCERDDIWQYATSANPTPPGVPHLVPNSFQIPTWLNLATAGRVAKSGNELVATTLAGAIADGADVKLAVRFLDSLPPDTADSVPHAPALSRQVLALLQDNQLANREGVANLGVAQTGDLLAGLWRLVQPAVRHAVERPAPAIEPSAGSHGPHVTDVSRDAVDALLLLARWVSTVPDQAAVPHMMDSLAGDPSLELLPEWRRTLPFKETISGAVKPLQSPGDQVQAACLGAAVRASSVSPGPWLSLGDFLFKRYSEGVLGTNREDRSPGSPSQGTRPRHPELAAALAVLLPCSRDCWVQLGLPKQNGAGAGGAHP